MRACVRVCVAVLSGSNAKYAIKAINRLHLYNRTEDLWPMMKANEQQATNTYAHTDTDI